MLSSSAHLPALALRYCILLWEFPPGISCVHVDALLTNISLLCCPRLACRQQLFTAVRVGARSATCDPAGRHECCTGAAGTIRDAHGHGGAGTSHCASRHAMHAAGSSPMCSSLAPVFFICGQLIFSVSTNAALVVLRAALLRLCITVCCVYPRSCAWFLCTTRFGVRLPFGLTTKPPRTTLWLAAQDCFMCPVMNFLSLPLATLAVAQEPVQALVESLGSPLLIPARSQLPPHQVHAMAPSLFKPLSRTVTSPTHESPHGPPPCLLFPLCFNRPFLPPSPLCLVPTAACWHPSAILPPAPFVLCAQSFALLS